MAVLIIATLGPTAGGAGANEGPENRIRSVSLSAPAVGVGGTIYVSLSTYTVVAHKAGRRPEQSRLVALNPDGTRKWKSNLGLGSAGAPFPGRHGTIYVALSGGYDGIPPRYLNPVLFAVDPHGARKWKLPLFQGLEPGPTGAPTVKLLDVTSDDTIYLYGGPADGQYIYAVNGDGAFKWKYAFAGAGVRAAGPDGTIYFFSDRRLRALGPGGALKWSYAVPDDVYDFLGNNLEIGRDGTIYVWGERGVIALNPAGKVKWKSAAGGCRLAIGPDGTVYVLGGSLYALNPDGAAKWKSGIRVDFGDLAVGHEGTVYVAGTTNRAWGHGSAELLAVDRDGTQRWKLPLGSGILPHIKAVGPDGIIYLLLEGAGGYGFLAAVGPNGTVKWHSPRLANVVGFRLALGPGRTVYISLNMANPGQPSCGAMYALNPSGVTKWKADFGCKAHSAGRNTVTPSTRLP